MKKISITTAVIIGYFILMSSLGIIAAVPGNIQKEGAKEKERVRREIINHISCPSFITDNSDLNRVKAIVSINENGKVEVSDINSANPQLIDYVQSQLQDMQVKSTALPEKFVLVINFKVD